MDETTCEAEAGVTGLQGQLEERRDTEDPEDMPVQCTQQDNNTKIQLAQRRITNHRATKDTTDLPAQRPDPVLRSSP
jgi:hypothetical protein